MLEISPAGSSQTPGRGNSNIDLLWWRALGGLDGLSQVSQCRLAYLPYQLHGTLEDNTAILLPALQIQNPSNIITTIRPKQNKTYIRCLLA